MTGRLTRRELYEIYGIPPKQKIDMMADCAVAQLHRRRDEFWKMETLNSEAARREELFLQVFIENIKGSSDSSGLLP